jgi:hypothetical protein
LNQPDFKALNDLSKIFALLSFRYPLSFPDFSISPELFLFSDYAGTGRDKFLLYSFLLTGSAELQAFDAHIKRWRQHHHIGSRRFEYKKLGDRLKLKLLPSFLAQADSVSAALFTFSIHTSINSIFGPRFDQTLFKRAIGLTGEVPAQVLEKMLRCSIFAAMIVNGLCSGDQNLTWISDNDDMVANDPLAIDLLPLVERVFEAMTAVPMRSLNFGEASRLKERQGAADLLEHQGAADLLSLCDLSCGYHVSHYREAQRTILRPARSKDALLSRWVARYGNALRKFSVTVTTSPEGGLTLLRNQFANPSPSGSLVFPLGRPF